MRSTRKLRGASRSASHPTTYQWPRRNHRPAGRHRAVRAPVAKADRGPDAHRLEQGHERRRRVERGERPGVADPGRAQLGQRVPATRIAQVHAGDGELQGRLFIGGQVEIGQVEGVGIDPVPVLLGSLDRLGQKGDPLLAEQPLVPLEGLAAGVVAGRVAGDVPGQLAQGHRPLALQQHEHEVGQPLQAVEGGHRGRA